MKTKKFTTSQLTILGLMAGILFLMAYTPLGYLNIGPLAVTFNVIPVAVCAIVLGPTGGNRRSRFWTDQFYAGNRNRRRKCPWICSVSDQSVYDGGTVFWTAYS